MNSLAEKNRFAPSPTGLLHFREIIVGAGADFITAALQYTVQPDFKAFYKALSTTVGKKGKALFLPLRVALTADTHGPEMDKIWSLLGEEWVRRRFTAAAAVCKG